VYIITDKFRNLEKEKQVKILNAAFREFAVHGYKKASTNRIVKEAGIGKGMLFYYFENKRGLYDDLIDYGTKFIKDNYLCQMDGEETDFIKKYRNACVIKMKAYAQCPDIFHFFSTQYLTLEQNDFTKEQLDMMMEVRDVGHAKLYENIDTSLFRKDIEPDKIIEMIKWTFDGYEKQLIVDLRVEDMMEIKMEDYVRPFYKFLDRLRLVYYE